MEWEDSKTRPRFVEIVSYGIVVRWRSPEYLKKPRVWHWIWHWGSAQRSCGWRGASNIQVPMRVGMGPHLLMSRTRRCRRFSSDYLADHIVSARQCLATSGAIPSRERGGHGEGGSDKTPGSEDAMTSLAVGYGGSAECAGAAGRTVAQMQLRTPVSISWLMLDAVSFLLVARRLIRKLRSRLFSSAQVIRHRVHF